MKIQTDSKLDVGYVKLKTGRVTQTVEVRPGILLDLDKGGQVLGIEILALSSLSPSIRNLNAKSQRTPKSTRTKRAA